MPPVVAGGVAGVTAFVSGTQIFGLTVLQSAVVIAGVNAAAALATQAIGRQSDSGGALAPGVSGFKAEARGRTQSARTTAEERRIVFGETKVGGPLQQFETTDNDKKLHVISALADHICDGFSGWFINDEKVGELDGSGNVTTGRFKDVARIKGHLGALDQAADSDAVSEIPNWTSDDKGGGVTYGYLRASGDKGKYPNGFDSFAALLRAALVYDPRDTAIDVLSSTGAGPAVFTTDGAHGLSVGDPVYLKDHDGAVRSDGSDLPVAKIHQVASVPASDELTLIDLDGVAVPLSTGGSGGTLTLMRWSDNPVLCTRFYLTHRATFDARDDEIDDDVIVAEANKCDEQVPLSDDAKTATADASTDRLSLSVTTIWRTGDVVRASTTGTLPSPLAADTDYYVIRIDGDTVQLATTLENARTRTAIDITDTGSGSHTLTRKSQLRYTCNGTIKLGSDPRRPLDDLMSCCAGVVTYSDQGEFQVFVGAATTASGTFDESDLAGGPVDMLPKFGIDEAINAARGTYISPEDNFTLQDAKPWISTTYLQDDNGQRIFGDYEFPFTDDPIAAQRLLKIKVERNRQGATAELNLKHRKFDTAVWDVETGSIDHFGWSGKPFRALKIKEKEDLSLAVTWREEAAAVWDWSKGEQTAFDLAPDTNLPNPYEADNPSGFTVETSTYLGEDGTRLYRLMPSWTPPNDQYVNAADGRFEIQYKPSYESDGTTPTTEDDYSPSFNVPGTHAKVIIPEPLPFNVQHDVRIRSVNSLGVPAESWQEIQNYPIGAAAGGSSTQQDWGLTRNVATISVDWGSTSAPVDRTADWGETSA